MSDMRDLADIKMHRRDCICPLRYSVRVGVDVQRWIRAGKPSPGRCVQAAPGAGLWRIRQSAGEVATAAPANGHRNRKSSKTATWKNFSVVF